MNYINAFNGILWLTVSLAALVVLQRFAHREIQALFLILTRQPVLTQIVFALIFFPGVLLHESSHFVMAKILGVQTGKFSLIPQAQSGGKLRLGYVETASGGFIRDALIGAAPLVSGSLFIAYVAIYQMQILPLWQMLINADWESFWKLLMSLPRFPDFWLWFYLTFTISSTMMPSESDRHAWLPLGMLIAALLGTAVIAGAGNWMLNNLAPPFNHFLQALSMIFGLSSILHILLVLPVFMTHRILTRITRVDIN